MANKKKKKKNLFTRADRGPTFVGFPPIVEPGKLEREEKAYKKHKGRLEEY